MFFHLFQIAGVGAHAAGSEPISEWLAKGECWLFIGVEIGDLLRLDAALPVLVIASIDTSGWKVRAVGSVLHPFAMRTWHLSGFFQPFATSKLAAHGCAIEAYLTATLALNRSTEAINMAILQLSLDYGRNLQILSFEHGSALDWFVFNLNYRIFQHSSDPIEGFSDLAYV